MGTSSMTASEIEEFWVRVDREGPVPDSPDAEGNCWLWTLEPTEYGYGAYDYRIAKKRYRWLAHRFSWTLHFGPIPPGLQVNHHCDVRLCVRPGHLYLGTKADNTADMFRRGRFVQSCGKRNPAFLERDQRILQTLQSHMVAHHEVMTGSQLINRFPELSRTSAQRAIKRMKGQLI